MNKTIIRVEHPSDQKGIFVHYPGYGMGDSGLDDLLNRHNKNFPVPRLDNGLKMSEEWFCAFKTIDQIQEWITKEEFIILIEQEGFKVYMIDVSECQEGEYQVIFRREDVLQTKDISSLFL